MTPTNLPAERTTGDLHLTPGAAVREPEGMRRAMDLLEPDPDNFDPLNPDREP